MRKAIGKIYFLLSIFNILFFVLCELFRIWTCLNYKSIMFFCKLEFLKQCKNFSVFPTHLSHICESKFYLKDFKSKHNLNKLLHSTKNKILNIESFDLHSNYIESKEIYGH